MDAVALLFSLEIRTGEIDEQSLTTTPPSIFARVAGLLAMDDRGLKYSTDFTDIPLGSSAASKLVRRIGRITQLTRPIAALDLRRGFVQDVKTLSDSRTAQSATGRTNQRTSRLYQDRSRESDHDWAARRLAQGTKGEVTVLPQKSRWGDEVLPTSEKYSANYYPTVPCVSGLAVRRTCLSFSV